MDGLCLSAPDGTRDVTNVAGRGEFGNPLARHEMAPGLKAGLSVRIANLIEHGRKLVEVVAEGEGEGGLYERRAVEGVEPKARILIDAISFSERGQQIGRGNEAAGHPFEVGTPADAGRVPSLDFGNQVVVVEQAVQVEGSKRQRLRLVARMGGVAGPGRAAEEQSRHRDGQCASHGVAGKVAQPSWSIGMTVPVSFLVGLMAGSIVAWIAQRPLRDVRHPLRTRFGAVALLLGGGALMPAGLALYVMEPAWALMYLAHPQHSAGIAALAVVFGLGVAPLAGLWTGTNLLGEHGDSHWWIWMGSLSGLLLVCFVAGRARMATVTYYEAFHYGGTGRPLTATALFLPAVITSTTVLMLMAFTWLQVGRHVVAIETVPEPASGQAEGSADAET